MLSTYIYHADWGTAPRKRWLARATLGTDGRYIARAPTLIEDHVNLIPSIRRQVDDGGSALVGSDFPIGIPAAYAQLAGVTEYKTLLRKLGHGAWVDFYNVATVRSEISVRRPLDPFSPGGKLSQSPIERLASIYLFSAAKVPRPTIETFVGPQLLGARILVGHPVRCSGSRFAFIGVHALIGHWTRSRRIPLYGVRFHRRFGVTVFCHL